MAGVDAWPASRPQRCRLRSGLALPRAEERLFLTPLAIWGGSLWSPLASALIFGLAGATVLILVVLPVIYSLLVNPREKERAFAAWARLRWRLLRREVGPRR